MGVHKIRIYGNMGTIEVGRYSPFNSSIPDSICRFVGSRNWRLLGIAIAANRVGIRMHCKSIKYFEQLAWAGHIYENINDKKSRAFLFAGHKDIENKRPL